MEATFHTSITDIPDTQWDALWQSDYPFTRHAFLAALELSGSINGEKEKDTGWQPLHLTLSEDNKLVAAIPLFAKGHSYGEYVFDWSWADAYQRAGFQYYPKLINAIPFTPSTGPRLGFAKDVSEEQRSHYEKVLLESLKQYASEQKISSFHTLFPNQHTPFTSDDFSQRQGYQFHWFNQDFKDFDDFLNTFSSRKRKNLKKERQKVAQQDLTLHMRSAAEIDEKEWEAFYNLYQRTYLKRSGHGGYLGSDFFQQIAKAFPEQVLLASAHHHGIMIAAALYLRDSDTLYGRYWGTQIDLDGLHFECCYYMGIEYAIQHKLRRFDPGAQGEHKIQRGFTPIKTCSYHWLAHPQFNQAIKQFTVQEAEQIDLYIEDARTSLPFKEGIALVDSDTLLSETSTTPELEELN